MKRLIILLALVIGPAVHAADSKTDGPATEATVRQLIEVTHASQMLDTVFGQMDAMMRNGVSQAMGGKQLTPDQQRIVDAWMKDAGAVMHEDLRWETLEPDLISVYQQSFTERELQSIVAFYSTDAGQAVIRKMPLVLQHSVEMMQKRLAVSMPKLQQLQQKYVEQLRATEPGGK